MQARSVSAIKLCLALETIVANPLSEETPSHRLQQIGSLAMLHMALMDDVPAYEDAFDLLQRDLRDPERILGFLVERGFIKKPAKPTYG